MEWSPEKFVASDAEFESLHRDLVIPHDAYLPKLDRLSYAKGVGLRNLVENFRDRTSGIIPNRVYYDCCTLLLKKHGYQPQVAEEEFSIRDNPWALQFKRVTMLTPPRHRSESTIIENDWKMNFAGSTQDVHSIYEYQNNNSRHLIWFVNYTGQICWSEFKRGPALVELVAKRTQGAFPLLCHTSPLFSHEAAIEELDRLSSLQKIWRTGTSSEGSYLFSIIAIDALHHARLQTTPFDPKELVIFPLQLDRTWENRLWFAARFSRELEFQIPVRFVGNAFWTGKVERTVT